MQARTVAVTPNALERALRHDRIIIAVVLAAATVLCFSYSS